MDIPAGKERELHRFLSRKDFTCLVDTVVLEAGNQTEKGQAAVAQIILARAAKFLEKNPDIATHSVCGVVYAPWQFTAHMETTNVHRTAFDKDPVNYLKVEQVLKQLADKGSNIDTAITLLTMSTGIPGGAMFYRHKDDAQISPKSLELFKRLEFVGRIGVHDFYIDPKQKN